MVGLHKALEKDDPRLRQICEPVTEEELHSSEFQDIINTMMDFVYGRSNKGEIRDERRPTTVGLSANQIGIMKRISIVDLAIGHKDYNNLFALINPEIISHSNTYMTHREGCVNLPEIWGTVKRYHDVKVKAWDRSGNEIIIEAKGLLADLMQHEIDHLNGKLFIDLLSDPTKAHRVKRDGMKEYRENFSTWNTFIDVSDLIRK